jgi:hypothetical protein
MWCEVLMSIVSKRWQFLLATPANLCTALVIAGAVAGLTATGVRASQSSTNTLQAVADTHPDAVSLPAAAQPITAQPITAQPIAAKQAPQPTLHASAIEGIANVA